MSEGWSSTNPVTTPQPDWEHKHDMATLTGVPDQILEENNRRRPRNVLAAAKRNGEWKKMIKKKESHEELESHVYWHM